MDDISPHLVEVFFDVQRGLPRQGIGSAECTRQALALCLELPERPRVLDIGCGPGMQTLALADACGGHITAMDNCHEYLQELRDRLAGTSLAERVDVIAADMTTLDFPDQAYDLLWCEGAIYHMGVAAALQSWRRLLREGGYLAFSELVWREASPDDEVAEFFRQAYPAMTDRASVEDTLREHGYTPVQSFPLPESAWWDDYYRPLEAKFPALKRKYAGDEDALQIIAQSEAEIDIRRRFPHAYGYQFFVAQIGRPLE